eukprot:m.10440 g.10440  ORF g.10440 m.10440 type:complete len:263 (-) comp3670_c0_seq1:223-1011(-)
MRTDFNPTTNVRNPRFFPIAVNVVLVSVGAMFIVIGMSMDSWLTQSFEVSNARDGYVRRGFWTTDASNAYGNTVSFVNVRSDKSGDWWDPFCSTESTANSLIAAFNLLFDTGSVAIDICCSDTAMFRLERNDPRTNWCSIKLALQVLSVLSVVSAIITLFSSYSYYRRNSMKPMIFTSIISSVLAFVTCCIFASIFFKLKSDANDLTTNAHVNGSYSVAFFVIGFILCGAGGVGELVAACSPRPLAHEDNAEFGDKAPAYAL